MTEHVTATGADVADVESFRLQARAWLAENMPRLVPGESDSLEAMMMRGDDIWPRARELQRMLYDGGFAGICFPREYGGLGLTPAHQHAFNEECTGYEMPLVLNTPTFSICGATVLDMASEEQKRQHLPAVIRGEEIMVQFLSEPRGGSDLAGVTTRATRDGDVFILNGSKIWSSGAYAADWALCLARTDWEAPKHRGMTMFLLKVHQPGIDIKRIKQVNGNNEFCQEFFDDVVVPASDVVGEVNGGWAVASRQLFHERNAVGGGSPYVSGAIGTPRRGPGTHTLIDMIRATGQSDDVYVRELAAEAHAIVRVQQQLISRVTDGMRTQQLPPPAAAIMRLYAGQASTRLAEIGVEILGSHAAASDDGQGVGYGQAFLMRQAGSLGGGSTEMSRNIISERVLGMPREFAADRDVPFSQVRQGR
ncbi:MAG TPA: acyl-CoA dehydrogenase family protein [Streptosporangiaceae bacterium]|nr:acyl-CoA dehydrogenase family protein [Streptosporangiaceae bacterium]